MPLAATLVCDDVARLLEALTRLRNELSPSFRIFPWETVFFQYLQGLLKSFQDPATRPPTRLGERGSKHKGALNAYFCGTIVIYINSLFSACFGVFIFAPKGDNSGSATGRKSRSFHYLGLGV